VCLSVCLCGTVSGVNHLCTVISKFLHSLIELNLSRTGLGARGVGRVLDTLQPQPSIYLTLRRLDLSFNSVKGEEMGVSLSCGSIFVSKKE